MSYFCDCSTSTVTLVLENVLNGVDVVFLHMFFTHTPVLYSHTLVTVHAINLHVALNVS
jgi:hypothetical protein